MGGPDDKLRVEAVALRLQGRSRREIRQVLGVGNTRLPPFAGTRAQRQVQWSARGGAVMRRRAEASRQATKVQAGAEVGPLTDQELWLVGVALYWAEGAKDKAWDRRERLTLINSDPRLILTFLRWLALCGVPPEDLTYRVNIHESAECTPRSVTGPPS